MPKPTRTLASLPAAPLAAAAVAALALSCATGPRAGAGSNGDALALVDRGLAAEGGADAVAALRTITLEGTASFWEPEQSLVPGGEPNYYGTATFTTTRDLVAGTARSEWVKKLVVPAPREYRFTEILTPTAGVVLGVDSPARTKPDLEASPPRHVMSGVRLATERRELVRCSPRLLADLRADPSRLARVPDVTVGDARFPAVSYRAAEATFTILFDPVTGLPARVRTLDGDSLRGDSTYDLVLSDWRDVGGVQIAHGLRYELSGTEVVRVAIQSAGRSPPPPAAFDVPPDLLAAAPRPATGAVPYQWVLRRQNIGFYLDSDAISYDPQASPGLRLVELAPGVLHLVGGTHNSLVVDLGDAVAVVDAPVDEAQSRVTLAAVRARLPGKPVRYLVLSHHHMDHAGGLRTYLAEGATLIVGAGAGAHFRRVLAAPDQLTGGTLARSGRTPEVVEVADRMVLGAGAQTLELHRIDNPHALGMLLAWVPAARLGFVADLWNPGRDKLGDRLNPYQAALVAAVRKIGIAPERIAGGHGGVADYAQLAALAGR